MLRLPVRAEEFVGDVAGRLTFHRIELARGARMLGEETGAAVGEIAQQRQCHGHTRCGVAFEMPAGLVQ